MDPAKKNLEATNCPLCGKSNDCQLCNVASYKGPCWCAKVKIPEALIAQVPPELRNQACICLTCVMKFHRNHATHIAPPKVLPGDFYFEERMVVFTAEYHLRRGYCCESDCRHCPYRPSAKAQQV